MFQSPADSGQQSQDESAGIISMHRRGNREIKELVQIHAARERVQT